MTKNIIIPLLLFSRINVLAFSLSESWLAAGFGYGNFFEKITVDGQRAESYIASPGLDIDYFQVWDNFGFFINLSFLFPRHISLLDDKYRYHFQLAYILGPAFRIDLNEKMKIKLGAGFSSVQTFGTYHNTPLLNSNFGIGGDAGFVYIVNRRIQINMGTTAAYQFGNMAALDWGKNEAAEWSDNYSMTGLRPYIRVGFMF